MNKEWDCLRLFERFFFHGEKGSLFLRKPVRKLIQNQIVHIWNPFFLSGVWSNLVARQAHLHSQERQKGNLSLKLLLVLPQQYKDTKNVWQNNCSNHIAAKDTSTTATMYLWSLSRPKIGCGVTHIRTLRTTLSLPLSPLSLSLSLSLLSLSLSLSPSLSSLSLHGHNLSQYFKHV